MRVEPVEEFETNDIGIDFRNSGNSIEIYDDVIYIYSPMYIATPNYYSTIKGLSQWVIILLTLISGVIFLIIGIRSKLENNKNNEKLKRNAKKAKIVFIVFLVIFLVSLIVFRIIESIHFGVADNIFG